MGVPTEVAGRDGANKWSRHQLLALIDRTGPPWAMAGAARYQQLRDLERELQERQSFHKIMRKSAIMRTSIAHRGACRNRHYGPYHRREAGPQELVAEA